MKLNLEGIRLALDSFELVVDTQCLGKVTGIFGASGAGKSTLLEIVAGLRRPTQGRVKLGDRLLSDTSARVFVRPEKRAIGYVPQDGALFPHLSVRKNLVYGRRWDTVESDVFAPKHVIAVLELDEMMDRPVTKLSGGEKQRVAMGRALLTAPDLLLFDEPLAGLDVPLKQKLMPYLGRVRDEFCVPMLYVSHSPDEIVALCDDVLVLDRGKVVRQGSPTQIFVRDDSPRYKFGD